MYDLSILIPARNEEFLVRTIEDILENKQGKTEIIVVLDGYFVDIPQHPDLTVIHNPVSVGQRAATNQACRLSKAKYVLKVDAHCAFDKGFDVKLMADMQDDWTVVPVMRNLHAFDWVCEDGHRRYQSPSGVCKECGKETKKDIVWIAKPSPQSTSYCFDSEPHFQYFNEFKKRPEGKGDLTETMSLQGSFFMLTRDKYWELNISDESFGSWGSQGIEVALKTRLSGGKVICNHKTWYAHMFRTQGGDFGFPYPLKGSDVSHAKTFAKKLFFDNSWEKQIFPLSSVLDKFYPIPGWNDEQINTIKNHEITLDRSGIYKIFSKTTKRVYIGSAVSIPERIFEHTRKLQQNKHHNIHLQNTYNKYDDDFIFTVIEWCTKEKLIEKEQFYIDKYKNEIGWENMFNIAPSAGSTLGLKMTEETKEKISKSLIGKEAWNKGLNKDTDSRIIDYANKQLGVPKWEDKEHPKGMLGKSHTEECKENVSIKMKDIVKNRERDEFGHFIPNRTAGIVYYTDNELDPKIMEMCQESIKKANLPIVSVSLKPLNFGKNVIIDSKRGYLTMFKQILAGLEAIDTDVVFFCEHDVLYHPSHFDFRPLRDDKYYYNMNSWIVRTSDGHAVYYDHKSLSGLCADRQLLIKHYKERIRRVELEGFSRKMGFEPGTHNRPERVDDIKAEGWKSEYPNLDLKHGKNLTQARWRQEDFRDQRNCRNWKETDEPIKGWEHIKWQF